LASTTRARDRPARPPPSPSLRSTASSATDRRCRPRPCHQQEPCRFPRRRLSSIAIAVTPGKSNVSCTTAAREPVSLLHGSNLADVSGRPTIAPVPISGPPPSPHLAGSPRVGRPCSCVSTRNAQMRRSSADVSAACCSPSSLRMAGDDLAARRRRPDRWEVPLVSNLASVDCAADDGCILP